MAARRVRPAFLAVSAAAVAGGAWLVEGRFSAVDKMQTARLYGNIGLYEYYFVDLMIGKPAQRTSVIVDTGSQITGFPCKTCEKCGPNHIDMPLFDLNKSDTGKWLGCKDPDCYDSSCEQEHCRYHQGYYEGSKMDGWWIKDYVQLDDLRASNPPVMMPIGCHRREDNLFYTQLANGIMGIRPPKSGRPTIFDALFADTSVKSEVFSLCFSEWGGQLTVGGYNESYNSGPIVWLDLTLKRQYYDVSLSKMTLGDKTLFSKFATVMMDSGTTFTFFPSEAYWALRTAVESYCNPDGGPCVTSFLPGSARWPWGQNATCFPDSIDRKIFPVIVLWFGEQKVEWMPEAYMYHKESLKVYCYGFANDGRAEMTTLGATFMVNSNFIFDMTKNQVGIAPANCPSWKHRPYLQNVSLVEAVAQEVDEWQNSHKVPPRTWQFYLANAALGLSLLLFALSLELDRYILNWVHPLVEHFQKCFRRVREIAGQIRDRARSEPKAEAKREQREVKKAHKARLLEGDGSSIELSEVPVLSCISQEDCPAAMEGAGVALNAA